MIMRLGEAKKLKRIKDLWKTEKLLSLKGMHFPE
jgi:hypothetical protein